MKGKAFPINLPVAGETKEGVLAPYRVHLVHVQSLHKSSDGVVVFEKGNPYHLEPVNDVNIKSQVKEHSDHKHYFVPITSFDGYNVLILENIEHKDAINELVSQERLSNHSTKLDKVHVMHAYGIDEVEQERLTELGYKQFESYCVEAELYHLLIPKKTIPKRVRKSTKRK